MTLDSVTIQALRDQAALRNAKIALAKGKISQAEFDYFLKNGLHMEKQQEPSQETTIAYAEKPTIVEKRQKTGAKAMLAVSVIMLVLLSIYLFMPSGGLTGHVTYEPTSEEAIVVSDSFTSDTRYALNVTNITGLKLSGVLTDGTANVYLVTDTARLLVWEGTATEQYSITTDKQSYAHGSDVLVTVTPTDSSYTLWLTDENGVKTVVQESFVAAVGGFILDALINDSGNITKATTSFIVRNDTNASKDIVREPVSSTLEFSNECVETCELEMTNGELSLEITVDGTLDISEIITLKERANIAPEQTLDVSDVTIEKGASRAIDLDTYFTDVDGDALTYDYMNALGVEMSVEGNTLTITGVSAGEGQSIIYASDLYELTQSNMFTITVLPGEEPVNTTNNETNQTTNETVAPPPETNTTNITIPNLDCSDPNPNLRPLGCLQAAASTYFKPQAILIEDLDRNTAARVTPIGNFLIKGDIVQFSNAEPEVRTFIVTSRDQYSNTVPKAWVASNGDLHLRGQLYEEQLNLVPTKGSYSIQNSQSVTVAYFDRNSGDLYIRGNLIPYRRTLE